MYTVNSVLLRAIRVINEQEQNEEDFKNESSENKCQIIKTIYSVYLESQGNSSAKNLNYWLNS